MKALRHAMCAFIACLLLLGLSSPALAISYAAGYERDNQWHNPFLEWGQFGAKAVIYTPSAYPVYHEGTMKATVQVWWPNAGNEWLARTGWKSDVAENQSYRYYEGYTPAHIFFMYTDRSWAVPRNTGTEYSIKYENASSAYYQIRWGGTLKSRPYLGAIGYKACAGHSRCSGGDNDFRAKYPTCSTWEPYGYWEPIGRSDKDYPISPTPGGNIYYETLIGWGAFTTWNWYYGECY